MKKNIISVVLGVIILVLAGGGFFYWWNNQKDIQELNKNLPAGVKVAKNIFGFGNEYRVVNKIDGYEFKVPSAWKGVNDINYTPERTEKGYTGSSITVDGKEGLSRVIGVDRFKAGGDIKADLDLWAKLNFNTFNLVGNFTKDKIGELEIVKTQENVHFGGEYVYFFKQSLVIYTITGPSEEFIREIISNGKW